MHVHRHRRRPNQGKVNMSAFPRRGPYDGMGWRIGDDGDEVGGVS